MARDGGMASQNAWHQLPLAKRFRTNSRCQIVRQLPLKGDEVGSSQKKVWLQTSTAPPTRSLKVSLWKKMWSTFWLKCGCLFKSLILLCHYDEADLLRECLRGCHGWRGCSQHGMRNAPKTLCNVRLLRHCGAMYTSGAMCTHVSLRQSAWIRLWQTWSQPGDRQEQHGVCGWQFHHGSSVQFYYWRCAVFVRIQRQCHRTCCRSCHRTCCCSCVVFAFAGLPRPIWLQKNLLPWISAVAGRGFLHFIN